MALKIRRKEKVYVTERALTQRINRKLRADNEVLRSTRWWERSDLGRFYIVNTRINCIAGKDVDIEKLGHELGVLKPWEVHH